MPTQNLPAREQFTQRAWPALGACVGCHGSQPTIDFMAPGTPDGAYKTIFEFQPPVVDVMVPNASLLLTMGKHQGPALAPEAATHILAWLDAERTERVVGGSTIRIGPFMPEYGKQHVLDLGVGGATITVVTEATETGLYAKRISISAGAGVRISHPLFVSRPVDPVLDDVDRFADVELELTANQTAELGPAWFLPFSPTDYLSIHFSTLEALQ